MSGAQDANMDPDVRISRDGLFNTGEDSNGYLLRYESPTRTFWFECYVEFIENVYDVVVGKIGIGTTLAGSPLAEKNTRTSEEILNCILKQTAYSAQTTH
jgi:hypothetical protein